MTTTNRQENPRLSILRIVHHWRVLNPLELIIQGRPTMIADTPSQWTSQDAVQRTIPDLAMITLLRSYIKKRADEGRDIPSLRRELIQSSLHPKLLTTLFDQANNAS